VSALPFALAVLSAIVLTPLAAHFARVAGYLDHPEPRKFHTSSTALLGGLSIFVATLGALLLSTFGRGRGMDGTVPYVLVGALVVLLLGLWDDRFGMLPLVKLVGQGSAAGILLASGAVPDLHLGPVANVALSLVVLVALMNAINFLDNMNGMVAGLAAIPLMWWREWGARAATSDLR